MAKSGNEILTAGASFEKYTVEKKLGSGGMGAVYLVRHNILDSLFALKVLFPDVAARNAQFVDRFIREAKLACKIKHPNLIAVHDAGKNSEYGVYYLIMDYVPGGSVRDILKQQHSIALPQAVRIITQIAGALDAAHRHRMVHRDIKPDNIMFAADGSAKLADLGIAKSADEQDTMLTMAAAVFGTPVYMSPEQAKDSSKVDTRADIYSLGIVFYEMLTGKRPFAGDNTIQILTQVLSDEPIPDIRKQIPDIPDELAALLTDMTAKNVDFRIQTPAELLDRLQRISSSAISKITVNHRPPANENMPTAMAGAAEVTMPTVVTAEVVSPEVTMPTIVTDEVVSPEVTMPTIATAEMPPDKTLVTVAACDETVSVPAGVPAKTAAAVRYEESAKLPPHNQSMPVAEILPQKRNRRLLLAVIAALSLVIAGCITVVIMQNSAADKDVAETNFPAPSTPPTAVAKSAKPAAVKKETAVEKVEKVEKSEKAENVEPPQAVADETVTKTASPQVPAAADRADGFTCDQLTSGCTVVLSGTPEFFQSLKKELSAEINIALLEAAGLGSYKTQLQQIIKAKPALVIIEISQKFAENSISIATFENLIWFYSSALRENAIPLAFVLSAESEDDQSVVKFNQAVIKLCQLHSIPIISNINDRTGMAEFIRKMTTQNQ